MSTKRLIDCVGNPLLDSVEDDVLYGIPFVERNLAKEHLKALHATAERPQDEEVLRVTEDARRDVRYLVTDYPVELLVNKFREKPEDEGDIYVPDYQRTLAWTTALQSYFIESLILRVPVPPIFFYDVNGRLEIVDGSQRMRTLVSFAKDQFALEGLEKVEIVNGCKYSDLPGPIQKRLMNTPIRSFVLDQGTDESTRIELFRRLNTTGKRLHDAEIRKGAYRGPFLDLIMECAASNLFRMVAPNMTRSSDPLSERQELVTRFFVYLDYYQEFRHDVRRFLDDHVQTLNHVSSQQDLARMKSEFLLTMNFINKNYPHAFYRSAKSKKVPRVRFEAVAIGVALALRENPSLVAGDTQWLHSAEFNSLVRTDASNSGPRLRDRIEYVRDRLLGR